MDFHRFEDRTLLHRNEGFIPEVSILEPEWSLFLLQLGVILCVCRLMCIVAEFIHQPSVVLEMIGGILLGPSVLGKLGKAYEYLFPEVSMQYLDIMSSLGLFMYMYILGLDFRLQFLKAQVIHSVLIAAVSIIVPFIIGYFFSPVICKYLQEDDCLQNNATNIAFYIYFSSAISITAFPVLARILKDSVLMDTTIGAVVMGAAAINDGIAWILLITAMSITRPADTVSVSWMIFAIVGYIVFMFLVLKWVMKTIVQWLETKYASDKKNIDNNLYSLAFMMVIASGWFIAQLGLDPIIGSFVFGLIVPRDTRLHYNCLHKMHAFFITMFLPIYFAYMGLRTDFTSIRNWPDMFILIALIIVAALGKFLGSAVPAYFFGFTIRESVVIGVLMNTRGLMAFFFLNSGLNAEIVSKRTYSVTMIMSLVNTFATYPLLQWIYPPHLREIPPAAAVEHELHQEQEQ